MLIQISSKKTLQAAPRATAPVCPPPRPKLLTELTRTQCRFCIADAPEGQMHRALFCAAPIESGPYCAEHYRRCRRPSADDAEALAAEIEAAINRPR
jgi:hypothetical protein